MLGFSRENLRKSHETPWLILDLFMLTLLMINLVWLLFDGLFETEFVSDYLYTHAPNFASHYQPIHDNFLIVDLVFIGLFLSEFIMRWGFSIARKEHPRWYFFPFLRWYDLVGCIPSPTTRLFRIFRVVSIVYRLHKYKIIDLNSTAVFRFIAFYSDVLIEELSDRIVIKVLSDAQKDIAVGSPLIEDVQTKVLKPRLSILSRYAAGMMNYLGDSIVDSQHGEVIRSHVQKSVGKAVRDNPQLSTFSLVPILGNRIEETLESVVTNIVISSMINLLRDLDSNQIDEFLRHGLNEFTAEDQALEQEMLDVVNECIELLKAHVGQQRWKVELENSL